MRIDVTWDVGGSVFTVKGTATSHEAAEWTQQGSGRNFGDLWCHAYGQFVFPGNGVFDFVNPMMSRYGHLLAQVKYKPLTKKQLFVPREPKPSKPVVIDAPVTTLVKHSNDPKWQLDWTLPVNPVASALRRNKIVLRAEKKDPTLASQFKHIVINWTITTKGMGVFAEDIWALAPATGTPATGTPATGTPETGTSATGTSATGTPATAPKSGLITLRQSHTGKGAAVLRTPTHGGIKWTMNIDPSDSVEPMTLNPGDWIELESKDVVGAAGAYNFTILVNWAEKDTSYYRNNLSINIISAP